MKADDRKIARIESTSGVGEHSPTAGTEERLIGRNLGPYRVLSLLGEGGFGSVYLAEQAAPVRRRVALKVIRPGMDSRAVVARFEAERQALALMDHPGVAKVFDAGVTEIGRPYFVMELVRGVPITRFCDQEHLGIIDRLRLMIQVCDAVQHAHIKGLIHRDLKPGNALVELVDGRPMAKIIDFGVAKALSRQLTDSTVLTEQGQIIGTPEYMSPEQARGSALDVDTRADVYSLGAILYELLTGVPPFDSRALRAGGFAGVQRIIEEEQPVRPSDRVSGRHAVREIGEDRSGSAGAYSRQLRGDLDWIVMRSLEKERARRYDSAGALARDLQRYLSDEPVEAGPPSAGYRARKFVRRHRAGVAAAVVAAVALIAAVVVTGWGLSQALRERQTALAHAAEAEAARDEAETARDEAEVVTSFLSDLIGAVDPGASGRDVRVRDLLDLASKSIGEALGQRPLVAARLRQTIGNAYRGLGLYEEADRHLEAAAETRRAQLGNEHPDTLRVLGNIAGLRYEQGRFGEAEALSRSVLAAWRGSDDDPMVLGIKNNLAQTYARMGRNKEAATLQAEVFEAQRRVQGPDHPHTLGAMVNLAGIEESLGRLAEAEALLSAAVEGWRRAHGAEHPGALLAMGNLAGMYIRLQRLPEAEVLFRRVLEVRTRVLGDEHPETLGTMANLGMVLSRMGQLAEAEAWLARAWAGYDHVLGETHPDTLICALNLMNVYEAMHWPEASRGPATRLAGIVGAIVTRPGISAQILNDGAWFLLTVQPDALRDAAVALSAATRACDLEREAGGASLWEYLDTLALAQFETGSAAAAAETQREAIRRRPSDREQFRGEMEQRLLEFEAAVRNGS